MNCLTHIIGFPRIGEYRELKFAIESYWLNKIKENTLKKTGKFIRNNNLNIQINKNIDYITVGDFAWYDHILNTLSLLGAIPSRFKLNNKKLNLKDYYTLARGDKKNHAMEMTKWFNTNYHYLVPEWDKKIKFNGGVNWLFEEIKEALKKTKKIKVVLIGPVSLLYLGKIVNDLNHKLDLLPKILKRYKKILNKIKKFNISYIQIEEPILTLELNKKWEKAIIKTYNILYNKNINIILTTYFGSINNLKLLKKIKVQCLHIDLIEGKSQLKKITKYWPSNKILSAGIIDGRNIWKNNLYLSLKILNLLYKKYKNNLWISSSCSLLHSPIDLKNEKSINYKIKPWLSFGIQKINEILYLKEALNGNFNKVKKYFLKYKKILYEKKKFLIINKFFKNININNLNFNRSKKFIQRIIKQKKNLHLPILPTTTIGSLPQTISLRKVRQQYNNNKISFKNYSKKIKKEIKFNIKKQEKINLDILVHGEPERNDMVEYFGENLEGFIITQNGWVQSYGSRCVKPPIIYNDIYRKNPITIYWTNFAQKLTNKPVKGMLTGPVTILQWSFLRNDIKKKDIAIQIALALKDEVKDLENSGIKIIQIDEPALREGLPLKKRKWNNYLYWAVKSFKIMSSVVKNKVQIHTHMCYSNFNDILPWISKMDADVITIETSKSNMKLLKNFKYFNYPNDIGLGVYDIHSPRISNYKKIYIFIKNIKKIININRIWINPDCGLKTRKWKEIFESLINMIKATKNQRKF